MELQTSYRVDRMLRHKINCRAPAASTDSIRILETLLVVTLATHS